MAVRTCVAILCLLCLGGLVGASTAKVKKEEKSSKTELSEAAAGEAKVENEASEVVEVAKDSGEVAKGAKMIVKKKSKKAAKKQRAKKCSKFSATAAAAGNLKLFLAMVKAADLLVTVNVPKAGFTIFAPTDKAVRAALADLNMTFKELVADKELLREIISLHVLPKPLLAKDLVEGGSFFNLLKDPGCEVAIEAGDPRVQLLAGDSSATVVKANLKACTTVVHVIDTVLLSCDKYTDESVAKDVETAKPSTDDVKEEGVKSIKKVVVAKTKGKKAKKVKAATIVKEVVDKDGPEIKGEKTKKVKATTVVKEAVDEVSPKIKGGKTEKVKATAIVKEAVDEVSPEIKGEKTVEVEEAAISGQKSKEISDADSKECRSMMDILGETSQTSMLVSAVKAAGFEETLLNAKASQTFFAPTDDAFKTVLDLLGVSKKALLSDKDLLTEILSYHVLPKSYNVTELEWAKTGPTILKDTSCGPPGNLRFTPYAFKFFKIMGEGSAGKVNKANISTCTGFVHLVDDVLLPCKLSDDAPADVPTSRKIGKVFYG